MKSRQLLTRKPAALPSLPDTRVVRNLGRSGIDMERAAKFAALFCISEPGRSLPGAGSLSNWEAGRNDPQLLDSPIDTGWCVFSMYSLKMLGAEDRQLIPGRWPVQEGRGVGLRPSKRGL